MALTAQRPQVAAGDVWRYVVQDKLRNARSEETRRAVEVTATTIACELSSTDAAFAGGRAEYTREWNLLSRPVAAAGDEPDPDNRWHWRPHYPRFRLPLAAGRKWRGRATAENPATGTSNVHTYRAVVLPATQATVPGGSFDVLPVRFESTVASDDGQSKLAWRNVETLFYAPSANLYVYFSQSVIGPDGRVARELALELMLYQPAR
jgi:hypothetical protein